MSIKDKRIAGYLRNNSIKLITVVFVLLVCGIFASLSPVFLSTGNIMNIVRQSAVLAVMAFGMVTVMLITGGDPDMSVAGVTGLSAAVAVTLLTSGIPTPIAIVLAILAGAAAGLLNGFLVTSIGLMPFLATLATSNMAMGLEQVLTKGLAVAFNDRFISFVANENFLGIPATVYFVAPIFVSMLLLFDYSRMGRSFYAIGGNLQVARMSGINVKKSLIAAFTLSGSCAGVAGVILMGRLSGLTPLAASRLHLDVVLAGYISAVISSVGAPSITGALFGAALVGVLSNGLAIIRVPTFYTNLAKGLLIIIVVVANALQKRRRNLD